MPEPTPCRCMTRRGLLLGTGTLLLTACASPGPKPDSTPTASQTSTSPQTESTPTASGMTTNSPSPTPTQLALPTRDDIVARFQGRKPTQWGMEVTGVVTRTPGPAVALTLDACGGPNGSKVDTELVDLLIAERFPATLFLNRRWIEANRTTFDKLAANDQFTIGNHGTRHMPLSVTGKSAYGEQGTANAGEVYDEVAGNHLFLTELLGRPPRFFRTGTAWYDEVAVEIVRALGEIPIGFDVNADAGATYPKATVVSETERATKGSIVIGHFNQPKGSTFEGLSVALPALRDRGLTFARLDDLAVS